MLTAVLGQPHAMPFLRAIAEGRLTSPVLLHGSAGCGKKLAAIATLLQAHPDPSDQHLLSAGKHPDVLCLDAGGVEDTRGAIEHLSTAPSQARWRALIIDAADQLSVPAQDSLLKTVEDPPRWARLFLVSSKPWLISGPLRSRCMPIRFVRLKPEILRQILSPLTDDASRLDLACRLCGGSADIGQKLLMGTDLSDVAKELLRIARTDFPSAFALLDQHELDDLQRFVDHVATATDVEVVEALMRARTRTEAKARLLLL